MNASFESPVHMNDLGDIPAGADQAWSDEPVTIGRDAALPHTRLAAAMYVARYHGIDPDPRAARFDATKAAPSSPVLLEWLRQSGLWARGVRLTFRQLMKIDNPAPILLLL